LKLSAQAALDRPHIAVVGFVVVSGQMQKAMKNQWADIGFERQ
jgi:hypothetical protein